MNKKIVEIYEGFNPLLQKELAEQHPELNPASNLICLDKVEDGEIKWLWMPYMQANNITVLRGDGGVGKSFLSCAIMAAISNDFVSYDMPGEVIEHGSIIYFGKEDDSFIIKNRVRSVGGDLSNIFIFEDEIYMSDIEKLRLLIKSTTAKLVIFDPIQSFLGSGINMNQANEIRPIMDRLREVARTENCAVLLVEHLNKATNQKALYRGIGSQDIVSSARSVLMVGFSPKEEDTRVCLQIKSNAKRGEPIAFKIDSEGEFSWQGTVNVTEEELVAAAGIFSNAKQKDALLDGIKAVMAEYPSGWKGSASDLMVAASRLTGTTLLTPTQIGKRMGPITLLLNKDCIYWSKRKSNGENIYEIYTSKKG